MRVEILFEENGRDYRALEMARLFCDLQHLAFFAQALSRPNFDSSYDLFDGFAQKYEAMVEADVLPSQRERLGNDLLVIDVISLQSPLKIAVKLFHFMTDKRRLGQVLDLLKRFIMLDLMYQRAALQNDQILLQNQHERQRVIKAALENTELGLRIAQQIPDPQRREEFLQNLTSAIQPFVNGSYPQISRIEITESQHE